jgi:L-cysteate sulfo-lyase
MTGDGIGIRSATGARLRRVIASLPELPRVTLLDGPTPLQPMERLSAALAGRAELWIKREDAGPIPFSGNKLRNLEFVLAAAIADGSDTIVTSGRRWSIHCRLAAVAGTRLGHDVHLELGGPHVDRSPNVELIELFGGTVHRAVTADRGEREAIVDLVAADLRRQGRRVTIVPVGGSGAIGAWGQVTAALEVAEQSAAAGFRPDAIVLPSASGGTQAGLVVGSAIVAASNAGDVPPTRVVGMLIARPEEELRSIIEGLVGELATLAGIDPRVRAIELDASPLGGGYGRPTEDASEAAALIARTEGILVDPVYTAKALAGLIDRVRAGAFDGQRVVFWHGGGLPAIFEDLTASA